MLKLIICFLLFFICLIFIHYNQPNNYNRIFISNYYKSQQTKSLTEIPLVVIQTLKEYEINEFFFQEVLQPKIKMNPEFTFQFYDNNSIDIFLLEHFPIDIYNAYKKINPKFI